jgi:hypothetical protein
MIKERRKEQVKPKPLKKASNADRSIATGRAKRDVAAKARRGLAQDKKPNAMDVERETYRQARKTDNAKKAREKKATGGRTLHRRTRQLPSLEDGCHRGSKSKQL